jgi:hypothetical protein
LLKAFAEHYVLHLEVMLRKLAGDAALQLAKQPKPVLHNGSDNATQVVQPATATTKDKIYTPTNARREARKRDTQAKYARWKRAYRRLIKRRPDASDVWCSEQIARMDIAEDSRAEPGTTFRPLSGSHLETGPRFLPQRKNRS